MSVQYLISDLKAGTLVVGNGAQFWAYISPQNDTPKFVTKWAVSLEQKDGNWRGTITSDKPYEILQTPNLSGLFNVVVFASGPKFAWRQLTVVDWSPADIGCNSNCASMVGIVATPDGSSANYWTTWDAVCKPI
jgi:hypothetical protein